eukprot:gene503-633_t
MNLDYDNFNERYGGNNQNNNNNNYNNDFKPIVPKKVNENEIQFMIPSIAVTILFIVNFSVIIPVLLGVSGLFYFQFGYLMVNYTSVERFERKSELKYSKKNGLKYRWRYDRGWKTNFTEVFGDSPIMWFLPIGTPKYSNGTTWKTVSADQDDDLV